MGRYLICSFLRTFVAAIGTCFVADDADGRAKGKTYLIAAGVLLIFGTGTIKGFATTLMISIIASYFTAVVVTRRLLILICKLGIYNRSAYTR